MQQEIETPELLSWCRIQVLRRKAYSLSGMPRWNLISSYGGRRIEGPANVQLGRTPFQ